MTGYAVPVPDPSGKAEGAERREICRKILRSQTEIFLNIVLYAEPGRQLDFKRLMEEHNGLFVAGAKEWRAFLDAHPQVFIPDPDAVDIADLTCEDP